ncbi:MAG: hypothetical protein WCZ66_04475 [Sphingomonadaceae bacterium]
MTEISDANVLRDIHSVRMLKYDYCALADECASPDPSDAPQRLAALFTEYRV